MAPIGTNGTNCAGLEMSVVRVYRKRPAEGQTNAIDPEPTLFSTSLTRPHLSGADEKFIIGASTYRGSIVSAKQSRSSPALLRAPSLQS